MARKEEKVEFVNVVDVCREVDVVIVRSPNRDSRLRRLCIDDDERSRPETWEYVCDEIKVVQNRRGVVWLEHLRTVQTVSFVDDIMTDDPSGIRR